jgi:hypothetical protein
MLRVLSVAWALLAVVAVGFVPPATPQGQATELSTVGAVGISGSTPAVSVRRVRAKLAHLDGQAGGSHPVVWSHVLWLATTLRPFVPDGAIGASALATPPTPPPRALSTARTSRGPPSRS